MSSHDTKGRPWAKFSEVKVGDTLITDDGFTCIKAGPNEVKSDGALYIDCSCGKFYLEGQLSIDKEHLIGIYKE